LYDEIAASMTSGVFVEVGVAYGRSLAYFASRAHPDVQILGVDSWLVRMGRNEPAVWDHASRFGNAMDVCKWFMAQCAQWEGRDRPRVELCQGDSAAVAYALDFEVDAVFLDGSHEYEAVKRDIQAWRARLKPGGMLAGHDANDHYPGVARAVRELLPGAEFRPSEDNGWGGCWVWRKP
jgi:hypothetical protein